MEMTKQRKLLIGVLCLGLGGLAVDRLIIGMPEAASAQQANEAEDAPIALERAVDESAIVEPAPRGIDALPSYESLAERLILAQQRVGATAATGREDPFAMPDAWATPVRVEDTVEEAPRTDLAERLNGLFQLDGTVRSLIDGEEEILAVISGGGLDGRAVRIGQQVRVPDGSGGTDAFELVEVGSRHVVWLSLETDERVHMRVDEVLSDS
jgi:hypothetical protein